MKTIDEILSDDTASAVVSDDQGFITEVNGRFKEDFGWTRTEIVGQPVTTIIPGSLRDAHNLGFARFLATGKPTLLGEVLRLDAELKDGTVVSAEHLIVAERRDGRWCFAASIRIV